MVTQLVAQERSEVLRELGEDLDARASDRMSECDPGRVEHRARCSNRTKPCVAMSVLPVAGDGVADVGELHADLIAPASLELAGDNGPTPMVRDRLVVSHRSAAAAPHGFHDPVGPFSEAALERSRARSWGTEHDGVVDALNVMLGKHAIQSSARFGGSGDDERPARLLIESMNRIEIQARFPCFP